MSIYSAYKTNADLERNGAWLGYKDCRIRLARLGGANKQALRVFQARMKPHQRAIATETMEDEEGKKIMIDFLANHLVKGWKSVNEDGDFVDGIDNPDGSGVLLPVTPANVTATFSNPDLEELLVEVWKDVMKADWYRESLREVTAKN